MYLRKINKEKNKVNKPLMISREMENFLRERADYLKRKKEPVLAPTIHVDEVSSKVAVFYEKIRKVVDWKEEHLMRRIAIERVLKRALFLKRNSFSNVGEETVLNLIRGGYFPNDSIKKSIIPRVQRLLEKYKYILENAPEPPEGVTKPQFQDDILKIAACETEEILDPLSYRKADILIKLMEGIMSRRVRVSETAKRISNLTEEDKKILIYIAVCQSLFKLDKPIITYNLIKRYYPKWFSWEEESIKEITENIHRLLGKIESYFSHLLADRFYDVFELYDTPFLLLGDVFLNEEEELPDDILDPNVMRKEIFAAYKKRLSTLRKRLFRSAFYSTLSVFLTNVFSLYLVEIPFTKLVTGKFNLVSALCDIFVPTGLMFFLVSTIRLPPKNNFDLVMEELENSIYQKEKIKPIDIEYYPPKGPITKTIFGFIYALGAVISLAIIIGFLYFIHFPTVLSYAIFVIFTSLIFFTGSLIRKRARELHMTKTKEGLWTFLIYPLILPIIHFGKWLAARWRKYNVVGIFFTILIDSPFVLFVEFLERWRYFLKEKQEEVH